MTTTVKGYVEYLAKWLSPLYRVPNVAGGHEVDHIEAMLKLGYKIQDLAYFDPWEYEAAVWLHNVDRCVPLKDTIKDAGGVYNYVMGLLQDTDFFEEARERIAKAVDQHAKKNDEPGDSPLLTALRIADKIVRLRPENFIDGVAHWLSEGAPLYDPEHPLDYQHAGKCLWKFQMFNFEWIGMLPSNKARDLIDLKSLYQFICAVRVMFGRNYIARREHLDPDLVDLEILKALGPKYEHYFYEAIEAYPA